MNLKMDNNMKIPRTGIVIVNPIIIIRSIVRIIIKMNIIEMTDIVIAVIAHTIDHLIIIKDTAKRKMQIKFSITAFREIVSSMIIVMFEDIINIIIILKDTSMVKMKIMHSIIAKTVTERSIMIKVLTDIITILVLIREVHT